MTGVVLCGGSSSRMGSDKVLLKEEETTWAELASQKLAALHLPFVVSINELQYETYSLIFPKEKLITDLKAFNVKGPLLGISSVHATIPAEDLLVLACDVKDITTSLLNNLVSLASGDAYDAFVYTTDGKPQPLCAVYTAKGLQQIYCSVQQNILSRFSMMSVLESLNTMYVPVAENDLSAFSNYNRPDELQAPV
ncbi:MAG TPA: molybdenum cofactor guanylyltransferase [Flavisolibacter sp.]|nr:molybdenum cofactor guanylyltransferase [Flavisolibacter sp.]